MKRLKKTAFSISNVINDMNLKLESKDFFCKKIVSKFKTRYPDHKTFKRHAAVCFFGEDRGRVEELVLEELSLANSYKVANVHY